MRCGSAVGAQITFDGENNDDPAVTERFQTMRDLADEGSVGLVAKGIVEAEDESVILKLPYSLRAGVSP